MKLNKFSYQKTTPSTSSSTVSLYDKSINIEFGKYKVIKEIEKKHKNLIQKIEELTDRKTQINENLNQSEQKAEDLQKALLDYSTQDYQKTWSDIENEKTGYKQQLRTIDNIIRDFTNQKKQMENEIETAKNEIQDQIYENHFPKVQKEAKQLITQMTLLEQQMEKFLISLQELESIGIYRHQTATLKYKFSSIWNDLVHQALTEMIYNLEWKSLIKGTK